MKLIKRSLVYRLCSVLILALAATPFISLRADEPTSAQVAKGEKSDELPGYFKFPTGFKADLFAASPQVANPVALCFDEQGRLYVAETFRLRTSTYDIRFHMDMFDDDIACRTVEDRLAMCKKFLGDKISDMAVESEMIRVLEDTKGTGRADKSTIFADGFNGVLDGVAAGVLARKGVVYFTDIPNLWLLQDTNHDGKADVRSSLSYGYGVRFGLTGHDLHGLRFGPDGKLYFSMGDRGIHVKTKEGKWLDFPYMGTVLRCDADGSNLEIFAYGVRNPQKLAFDDHGNLFTGDNNCDHGDAARLVYVVEGGDSGWRSGNQFSETTPAGVWNSEDLWHTNFPGQAAYLLPPVAYIADGPSGLVHYPGTGFPDSYQDRFFLCDFKGAPVGSGIHCFGVEPDGATFKMVGRTNFFWNVLASDVEFSPDGHMFVTDWVGGWTSQGQGRVDRLYDPASLELPIVKETQKLIAEGMTQRPLAELAKLLAHPDQRVRQEAQFELADRGLSSLKTLEQVAANDPNQLARLHAIWGLGQIRVKTRCNLFPLLGLLHDGDAEVRAQTAKVFGDSRYTPANSELIKLLQDAKARPRFFAAISLGKLDDKHAIKPILEMLRANAGHDVYLRHAGVMGLAGLADKPELLEAARDTSAAVRMGAALAMRRLKLPEIAVFLNDADPLIVLEAARAINDVPIDEALPQLAALITHPTQSEPLDWRVINANFHLGTAQSAEALATYAARNDATEKVRSEALHALETWAHPVQRDRLTGNGRVTEAHDGKIAADALRPVVSQLVADAPEPVRLAAITATESLSLTEAGPALFQTVDDTKAPVAIRIEALKALAKLQDPKFDAAVKLAAADADKNMRKEANRLQAEMRPGDTAPLEAALANGTVTEQQGAFVALGNMPGEAADKVLAAWLDKLAAGGVPKEIQFDLIEGAGKRTAPTVRQKLQQYLESRPKDDEFTGFRETLYGGDPAAGRKIFTERPEVSCARCHKIHGEGGAVGPELSGIIKRHDREYILESILFPNKQIAPGYESVTVQTKSGPAYAGILKSQDGNELKLFSIEDNALVTVPMSDIQKQVKGQSAMPEGMGGLLSKRDIRNVVEFLAELQQ